MRQALPVSCGTGARQPRQRNRVCIRPHGQVTARFAFGAKAIAVDEDPDLPSEA